MRCFCTVIAVILWCSAVADAEEAKTEQLGFAKVKPTSGRFVQIGDQFMVPYVAKIPGTDITYEMLPTPAGRVVLGSPADEAGRKKDEGPQVPVRIEAMWVGKCEVTWGEYHEYMAIFNAFRQFKALKIRKITRDREMDAVTAPSTIYDNDSVYEHGDDPKLPAVTMTQFAAKQYTHWLSGISGRFYRLPSEAEWEYACRAGSATPYSFGTDAKKLAQHGWYEDNSDDRSHKVGLKRPNAWGFHDMHGNVGEWVLDAYAADGYAKLDMGRDVADVIYWPTKRFGRVVRGGCWDQPADQCRSAARRSSTEDWWEYDPDIPNSPWWLAGFEMTTVGFRIVRPLRAPKKQDRNRYWDADGEDLRNDVAESVKFWRGGRGLVDRDLPEAIQQLEK